MHLIYIDDSGDEKIRVFSALAILADKWNTCFNQVKGFRRELKMSDGIFVETEISCMEVYFGARENC